MSDKGLAELQGQSYREGTQDGVNTLSGGIIFFYLSLFYWSVTLPEPVSLIVGLSSLLFLAVPYPLTRRLRERYTYPRTGYVRYRGPERSSIAVIVLSVLIGIILMVVLLVLWYGTSFDLEMIFSFMPLYIGLVMIPPSILIVKRTGTRHLLLQGILMTITGLAFVIADFGDPTLGLIFYLLLWSGVMVLVGLVKLFRFIKKYPVLELPEGDTPEQRKSHFY